MYISPPTSYKRHDISLVNISDNRKELLSTNSDQHTANNQEPFAGVPTTLAAVLVGILPSTNIALVYLPCCTPQMTC
jgi:hypothetical protein